MEGDTPDHSYRCHFPVGTPAGDEALARNKAEGRVVRGDDVEVAISGGAN